jgi:hypothetical protein
MSICLLACAHAVSLLASMHYCSLSNSKRAPVLSLHQQTCITDVYLKIACTTAFSATASMHHWSLTNSKHAPMLSLRDQTCIAAVYLLVSMLRCCLSINKHASLQSLQNKHAPVLRLHRETLFLHYTNLLAKTLSIFHTIRLSHHFAFYTAKD